MYYFFASTALTPALSQERATQLESDPGILSERNRTKLLQLFEVSGLLLFDLRARSGYQARHQTPGESLPGGFCDGPKALHHNLARWADSAAKSRSDLRQGLQVSRSEDAPMHYLFRAPAGLSRISRARALRLLRPADIWTRPARGWHRSAAGANHLSKRWEII